MSSEIALFRPPEALPEAPALPQAHSDDQLVAIWLHGRSPHTQRAYQADVARFRRGAGKAAPIPTRVLGINGTGSDRRDYRDLLETPHS